MSTKQSLDRILEDFNPKDTANTLSLKASGAPVTIWLPAEAKARYDRLQEASHRQFSKKAREALLLLIDLAEARAS